VKLQERAVSQKHSFLVIASLQTFPFANPHIPVTVACLHQLLTVFSPLYSNTPSIHFTGERTSGRGNSGWCLPALWVRTPTVLSVCNYTYQVWSWSQKSGL